MLSNFIILVVIFIIMLIAIAMDILERSIIALIAAMITYLVLIFGENASPVIFPAFIFGNSTDGYSNLHSLILIFSMMLLVQISKEGGLFQYLAFHLIKLTKGRPYFLMVVFCVLAIFLTAVINDILTVIILIPLTITVSRILNLDPIPYIITQAIVTKLGATIFMISSIPSILVASHLQLSFSQFFLNIGLSSIGIAVFTILFFLLIYRNKLQLPRRGIEILLEFNIKNFVSDQSLLYKSIIILSCVIIGFIAIPQNILSADMIALIGAIILATISKLDLEKVIQKMDFKLLVYLMGIFVVTGGLEYIGLLTFIGNAFQGIEDLDKLSTFLLILWLSAAASSMVDNIPIIKLMMPIVDILTNKYSFSDKLIPYMGLTCGIVWGDNLSPFGDTILVLNIANQNKVQITPKTFFRIGFVTSLLQFGTLSLFYSIFLNPIWGLVILGIISLGCIIVLLIFRIRKLRKIGFERMIKNHAKKTV